MNTTTDAPWIVAVGASGAEGLRDLTALVKHIGRLNAIVMIVLHRPWDKISALREILDRAANMPVRIAAHAELLSPGKIYIGEPSRHLTLTRTGCALIADPGRRYRNRTIDLMFTSLARLNGRRAIGVVLSGSLDDGARGMEAIHQAGGCTMVISPNWSTRQAKGMPEHAIMHDGPVSFIGDVARIAHHIICAVEGRPSPAEHRSI